MKKLDKIDYHILDILQKNSRISNQDLASMVSLAPSSCLQRVRRLQSSNLISGYHARLNLSEICEFVTCIVNVKLKSHSHEELQAFNYVAVTGKVHRDKVTVQILKNYRPKGGLWPL